MLSIKNKNKMEAIRKRIKANSKLIKSKGSIEVDLVVFSKKRESEKEIYLSGVWINKYGSSFSYSNKGVTESLIKDHFKKNSYIPILFDMKVSLLTFENKKIFCKDGIMDYELVVSTIINAVTKQNNLEKYKNSVLYLTEGNL